jgi:hypothetical protein
MSDAGGEVLIVKIKNITGTFDYADYHFEVFVNDTVVSEGTVDGHFRRWGYAEIIRLVAKAVETAGNPKPADS